MHAPIRVGWLFTRWLIVLALVDRARVDHTSIVRTLCMYVCRWGMICRAPSYKSELGATWRGLDAVTQRSYIVVSVKKAEACMSKFKGRCRRGSFTERYMVLLRYVFELLVS